MKANRDDGTCGVPQIVQASLDRAYQRFVRAVGMPTGTDEQALERLAALATACRWEACWWSVLERWVYSARAEDTPLVFGPAVIAAQDLAERRAAEYETFAARVRERAQRCEGVAA